MTHFVCWLLILFALSLSALACDEKKIILTFFEKNDGTTRIFAISESHMARLPNWAPGQDDPPFSFASAWSQAQEKLSEYETEKKQYELSDVRIAKKPQSKRDIWFYIFTFTSGILQDARRLELATIVVLMDGTALSGTDISTKEFYELLRKC